ncbi:MAG: VOC family protein [Arenibacter algicola]|nr:VOC family protein [Arenibacter algicola]
MTPQVHLITLGVRDMSRARAFYETMGWTRSPISMDEVTFYQSGQQVLGLYLMDDLIKDTGLDSPAPGGITLAINTQSRDEVDALLSKAVAAGGTVLKAPKVMPWGGYTAYVADPDGHPWEFSHVAQLVPDANGALVLPDSL